MKALWGWRYVIAVLSLVGWLLVEMLVSGNLLFQLFAVAFLVVTVLVTAATLLVIWAWKETQQIVAVEIKKEVQRRLACALISPIAQERIYQDSDTPRRAH